MKEVLVSVNDKVSEGTPIVVLEGGESDDEGSDGEEDSDADGDAESSKGEGAEDEPQDEEPAAEGDDEGESPESSGSSDSSGARDSEEPAGKRVVVVGSGPGGYTAAFRAADLGLEVTLVERHEVIGGVCLNVGCIPSKALLHAAKVLGEAEDAAEFGISFSDPEIDVDKLRSWKEDVVGKLTGGLDGLAKKRKVNVVHGEARFHLAEIDRRGRRSHRVRARDHRRRLARCDASGSAR